eukprot:TRINITY_DN7380_c0_g1_i12.p1 TRINITY_DN7380_c0_g1~~TRINITY_DN7380_c0_g1_i12.p1  ORF type:complete len:341 (+),score=61.51 TRINITY_DN7380_c0_g1_i12:386-1408(+)
MILSCCWREDFIWYLIGIHRCCFIGACAFYSSQMEANPADPDARIILTEAAMNPIKNREKLAEIIFEHFGYGKMQIGVQALFSLFAEGLMTATVLDSGDGVTHVIPIFGGAVLKDFFNRINLAGRHITNYLIKLLFLRGYAFNSSADFETVREIKEKFCFCSADIDLDRRIAKETTAYEAEYRLPDKTLIKLGRERFEAAEMMFNPLLAGMECMGAGELAFDSINKSPIDCRKDLYENILISGGTSMFPGFPTRLEADVEKIYTHNILKGQVVDASKRRVKIKVLDPPRRKYNVFIGAGVYAKVMDKQPGFWLTRQDWDEQGARLMSNTFESMAKQNTRE